MGIIHKALKIRIYPNKEQEIAIKKTIGCARFIYNHMLAERIEAYQKLKNKTKELFEYKYKTEAQYKKEFDFLKEADSQGLQQSKNDLSVAYQNFFRSLSGKRKGTSGFPKFHKKGRKDSYRTNITNNNIQIDYPTQKVRLPKFGWMSYRDCRNYSGKMKSATISRTKTGKYFVSLLFEQELELQGIELTSNLKTKGLDMSMSNFFVDDQGNSPAYERLFRTNELKIAELQRKVSKKKLGSNKRKKVQHRVNVVYETIANKRKDFTHKLSTKLVKEYDVIVVENLNLKAMAQCLNLGKSVNDLGYGMFLQQLQYKTLWNNKILIEADKWFASSKTCSKCGFKHSKLQLQDRIFNCPSCGFEIDRDTNAGINLKNYGIKELIGLVQPEFKPAENTTYTYTGSKQVGSMKREAAKSLVSQ